MRTEYVNILARAENARLGPRRDEYARFCTQLTRVAEAHFDRVPMVSINGAQFYLGPRPRLNMLCNLLRERGVIGSCENYLYEWSRAWDAANPGLSGAFKRIPNRAPPLRAREERQHEAKPEMSQPALLSLTRIYTLTSVMKDGRPLRRVQITCSDCAATEITGSVSPRAPAQAIGRFFRTKGWQVDSSGKRAECPACLAARRTRPAVPAPAELEPIQVLLPPPAQDEPAAPPPAPIIEIEAEAMPEDNVSEILPPPTQARRLMQMFELLDQHFDKGRCRYADGWSDDKVAAETQLSPRYVRESREQTHGKIAPPLELIEERAAIAQALQAGLAEIKAGEEMLQAMRNEFKARMNALQLKLDATLRKYA